MKSPNITPNHLPDPGVKINLKSIRLVFALFITIFTVTLYNNTKVDGENFALGIENKHIVESFNGADFTASNVKSIKAISNRDAICERGKVRRVIWLGNSQLHTINQYLEGQHLAPFWLRESASIPECFEPMAFSLPNANFQEYLILSSFLTDTLRPDAAVLSLVFDDLREDGLRQDFSAILDGSVRERLLKSQVGRDILLRFDIDQARSHGEQSENQGLDGFVQKSVEDTLTDALGRVMPLWADRPNLRARLMTDLYFLRNFVLNIKPTTVRKQIPARYERNMAALEATLEGLHTQGIPVVLYIAPIRQDVAMPYDQGEYARWKMQVAKLADKYRAALLNLEMIVPAQFWGTYHNDDVDFMHFQGEGHRLLGRAILPALHNAIGKF